MTPKRFLLGTVCTTVVALGIWVGWISAQPSQAVAVETLLPANSILYLKSDGLDAHREAFEKTAAYQSLVESGLTEVINEALKKVAGESDAEGIFEIYEHLQNSGFSLSVAVEPPADGPPGAWGVLVAHRAGPGVAAFTAMLQRMGRNSFEVQEQEVGGKTIWSIPIPDAPVELGWWAEGGHLVVAFGMNAFANAVAVVQGDRENLSTNRLFQQYATKTFDFEADTLGWLDFESLRESFGPMPIPAPQRDPQPTVNDILTALGLETFNHAGIVSGYSGKSLWTETWIDAPGERKGLMSLLDQPKITLADLPPLPQHTMSFGAFSADWGQAYDTILASLRKVMVLGPPDAAEEFEADLEDFNSRLGMSIGDMLDPLGNLFCAYVDSAQGIFSTGIMLMSSVEDPAKLTEVIDLLLGRLEIEAAEQVQIRTVSKRGRDFILIDLLEAPVVTPVICLDDGWLMISIQPQTIETALMRKDGKLPVWEPDGELKQAFAELPQEFTGISVSDPKQGYSLLLGLAPMYINLFELGLRQSGSFPEDFEMPIRGEDIPPAELVTTPLFPNVTVSGTGENGVRTIARQSLPSGFGGGNGGASSIATVGVAAALLLPAVQSARHAAQSANSKNHLKMMGLALHNYHDIYGSFPEGTVPNPELEPEQRLSWMVSILPMMEQAPLWTLINMKVGWESDENLDALWEEIPEFRNPSVTGHTDTNYGVSHYVGNGGLTEEGPLVPARDKRAGIFGYNRATQMRDITDGSSNTVMVSEASSDFGPWGAGGRSTVRPITAKPYINGPDGIGSESPAGCNMLFADGSVRTVSPDADPSVIEAIMTIGGGEVVGDF